MNAIYAMKNFQVFLSRSHPASFSHDWNPVVVRENLLDYVKSAVPSSASGTSQN